MVEVDEAIQLCNTKSNKEAIMACKFDVLHKITEKQDIVNLDLIKTLDDDTDERWVPLHMVNNANAIILGVSRNRGWPKPILHELYVKEKVGYLNEMWDRIRWTYGD